MSDRVTRRALLGASISGAALEAHGCLGGVWTSGMLSYIMDSEKPGLNAELVRRLVALDAHRPNGSQHYVYDVEAMKYVLEELCRELIWEGCNLVATAEQIGVRDGRRILGRYSVTVDDVRQGARHQDAVCRSTFGVDVHAATLQENKQHAYSNQGVTSKPFDIPLRALIAREVDALMMAGRCISGDFFAHASYRVTGNAVAMGEAAGATAAVASRQQRMAHQVAWPDVAAELALP